MADINMKNEKHNAEQGKQNTYRVCRELSRLGVEHEQDAPLNIRSSFRIGGLADIVIYPADEDELAETVAVLKKEKMRFLVVGNCTNIVFDDDGFRGSVVYTGKMKKITVDEEAGIINALCGAPLTLAATVARDAGLTGLEFAYGIPGTCGGAVTMNAGAYGGQMSDVLMDCRLLDTVSGDILTLTGEQLDLSYRHSIVKERPELVVLSVRMKLSQGDRRGIAERMQDLAGRRRDKQPLEYPSAGSVFKRPAPDMYVGKMIEDSGLKGMTVGGAQVSMKHAGFIINTGGATSADVKELIRLIKQKISQNYGVDLECEICFIPEK